MKLLDYYYLVILRLFDYMYGKDKLSYRVTGPVTMPFMMNIASLTILFVPHIIVHFLYWIILAGISIVMMIVLDIVYNKECREKLREQYKDENEEDRLWRITLFVLYIIFTVGFFIFAFWIFWKTHGKPPAF